MSLNVSQTGGGEFENVPEGQYIARCIKVIDLGTQYNDRYENWQSKIYITWEILDDGVRMTDGRPFAVSQMYTASLNEKSRLYADLTSWRGKKFTPSELLGFDISKLLGAYCQIQVIHAEVGDKTYANVNTIMSTKERPEGINETVMFDIESPDMKVFDGLGKYLQGKIQGSQEWNRTKPDSDEETPEPKDILDGGEEINVADIPF